MDDTAAELAGAFAEAAGVAVREMTGAEVLAGEAYPARPGEAFGDVSAVFRLRGGSAAVFAVSAPAGTAAAVARAYLREVTAEPPPELVRDCVGEVGNVIAGQAKVMLGETRHRFAFGPPALVDGPADVPGPQLVIPVVTDLGPLTLQIGLGG